MSNCQPHEPCMITSTQWRRRNNKKEELNEESRSANTKQKSKQQKSRGCHRFHRSDNGTHLTSTSERTFLCGTAVPKVYVCQHTEPETIPCVRTNVCMYFYVCNYVVCTYEEPIPLRQRSQERQSHHTHLRDSVLRPPLPKLLRHQQCPCCAPRKGHHSPRLHVPRQQLLASHGNLNNLPA